MNDDTLRELRLGIRGFLTNELHRDVAGVGDGESLLIAGAIDSLGVLRLVSFIEQQYGLRIEDDDLVPENFDTIECIAAFVASKRDGTSV